MGYMAFRIKLWRRETAEAVRWKIAWLLPRSIALMAFVRVAAATGECPDDIRYDTSYRAWEQGAGK